MQKRVLSVLLAALLLLTACGSPKTSEGSAEKKDLLVVTDNETEAKNALVRMSLYLNDLNLKGIYDVSEGDDLQKFYSELAEAYDEVVSSLKEKDEAYPDSIENLYSKELENIKELEDVFVLDFTKDFDFSEINLEKAKVFSAYDKTIEAKEHFVFEDYDSVFGQSWQEQELAYRKAFHPSFFAELEGYKSPIFQHYHLDEEGFIGELPSLSFLSLVNPDLTWIDEEAFSSWTGHLLKEDGKYHVLAEEFDYYDNTKTEKFALQRFLEHIQNDFKNRLAWTVGEGSEAVEVSFDQDVLSSVKAGDSYSVQVTVPEDQDYYYHWWYYADMNEEALDLELDGWGSSMMEVQVPEELEKGTKLHFILELEDAETAHKTLYRRVVEVK